MQLSFDSKWWWISLALAPFFFFRCSSGDAPAANQKDKLIGTWLASDPYSRVNNRTFTFDPDKLTLTRNCPTSTGILKATVASKTTLADGKLSVLEAPSASAPGSSTCEISLVTGDYTFWFLTGTFDQARIRNETTGEETWLSRQ